MKSITFTVQLSEDDVYWINRLMQDELARMHMRQVTEKRDIMDEILDREETLERFKNQTLK